MYPFFGLALCIAFGMGMTVATVPTRVATAFAIVDTNNSTISCLNDGTKTCEISDLETDCDRASDKAQDATVRSGGAKP